MQHQFKPDSGSDGPAVPVTLMSLSSQKRIDFIIPIVNTQFADVRT